MEVGWASRGRGRRGVEVRFRGGGTLDLPERRRRSTHTSRCCNRHPSVPARPLAPNRTHIVPTKQPRLCTIGDRDTDLHHHSLATPSTHTHLSDTQHNAAERRRSGLFCILQQADYNHLSIEISGFARMLPSRCCWLHSASELPHLLFFGIRIQHSAFSVGVLERKGMLGRGKEL